MANRALRVVLGDRPLAYHPILAEKFGGVENAIWLGQLLYWDSVMADSKNQNYSEWFYKSDREIMQETKLSSYAIRRAKFEMMDNAVIETAIRGIPPTTHYKINYEQIEKMLESEAPLFVEGRQIDLSKVDESIPRRSLKRLREGRANIH